VASPFTLKASLVMALVTASELVRCSDIMVPLRSWKAREVRSYGTPQMKRPFFHGKMWGKIWEKP
jgi:hypothetical protein